MSIVTTAATSRTDGGGVIRALLRPAAQSTYEKIFATIYVGLMVNVLLAVACAPLLAALAIVDNPFAAWPFFLALTCMCAPALAGAFGCFVAMEEDGAAVWRPFWRAYRTAFRRALAAWAAGAVVVGVLVVDAMVVARSAWGGTLIPFFITTATLVVAVVVGIVVVAAERPDVSLRDLVRACLYLLARRWYLAIANVIVLALLVGIVLLKPAVGVFLACSPLLYVVWANTRYALNHSMIINGSPPHRGPGR